MSAAEKLVEAHVQDCGLELFSQYRTALNPSSAPQLAATADSRSKRRSKRPAGKAPQDTDVEAAWSQFWIAAVYIGIDDLDDNYPDVQTWATALEAPLILNVYATKFSQLGTKEQQVALILRIRDAWCADFYRTLRCLDTPIILARTPSHGFLTQLAKLADRQSLAEFSAHFPQWLISFIRNSHTAAVGLAAHERGEREVGRAEITAYLSYLTTNKDRRSEAVHNCPRLTFNESNKKRRKITHTHSSRPRVSQSPQPIEQPRRDTLAPLEEVTEDIDEAAVTLAEDLPLPHSPARDSPVRAVDTQADETLDISGVDFEAEPETNDFEHVMTVPRCNANNPQSKHATPESNDALAATAVHNASALSLHERVQRRHDALKTLSDAKQAVVDAQTHLSSVASEILTFLDNPTSSQDVSSVLQDAITYEAAQLEKMRKTHAALETFRASLRESGISEGDDCLKSLAINQPGWFNDTPDFANQVELSEIRLVALNKHKARHKDAFYDERTASHKLESVKKALIAVDKEYQDFMRTVLALGRVDSHDTLQGVLQYF